MDRAEKFMDRALELARQGWGKTHPNPMVGAVIAQGDEIVAEGFHAAAGEPHAEINALNNLKKSLTADATLYVTLEPCCTQGRTPPCADAIIKAGVKRVVVGATDPNPEHQGRGIETLRQAGIEVESGVLAGECEDLNLIYNHWIERKTPLIAGKVAITLDGRSATRTGHSKWITGEQARADVMRWRRYFPAIAVGAGTVLSDNPRLTSRLDDVWCPLRFIFDRQLRTVGDDMPGIYRDEFCARTIVVTMKGADPKKLGKLTDCGVAVWELESADGAAFFKEFRSRCSAADITGVYCEGGSQLLSSLLDSGHLDYLFCYRSPVLLADPLALPMMSGQEVDVMAGAFRLHQVRHASMGEDALTRGFLVKGSQDDS